MRFGLVGFPIGHSQSPDLFKAAYPQFGYDLIETPDFDEAMSIFKKGYDAVNVTAPFKEAAFLAADRSDEKTALIGAANILRKEADGSISAFNSDYSAVKLLLQRHMRPAAPRKALVVGCGGAGKAAALAALDLGLETVIANRTLSRTEEYCRRIGGATAASLEEALRRIGEFGVIIFTLPVPAGMAEAINGSGILHIEANYRTPSLSGSDCIAGEEWLKAQAETGYSIMVER